MSDKPLHSGSKASYVLVALIAAQTACTVAYHSLAKGLAINLGTDLLPFASIVVDVRFWCLVGVEGGSLVLWMLILARIDLARAFPLTALSYILIIAVGHFVYNERVSPIECVGSLLILAGILLLAQADKKKPS
ncbi:EamA family transporter [Asticcacaulis benevestitus]|uniref:EamA domain-containing protein n=1 Tax=Asticcacaulis benevestitus DSM 16100 = ATCC BAA-896 TaxID=1121022 RepID=V4P0V3_9CAUL|nr:EamA family transporter [Asticcacaulis benevestitus]ESQ87602.1 hypothetical protein ABENE_17195 [Asticcacaulis benevestitus DSM 16100 = ATCC BAA-896]